MLLTPQAPNLSGSVQPNAAAARRFGRRLAILAAFVFLAACTGSGASDTSSTLAIWQIDAPPVPQLDPDDVEFGERLYMQSCASCHGTDLSGEPNWKKAKPDGSYPAPPHDASGHSWHHSDKVLLELVRDGLDIPESRMPSFGDRMTDDEIAAILDFIKSKWGEAERSFQWQMTWQELQRERGGG